MRTVTVLGSTGMLGSMVYAYLESTRKFGVTGTTRNEFDAEKFLFSDDCFSAINSDFIVNCIGITKPHCRDNDLAGVQRAIRINAWFPHKLGDLARRKGIRVIQIATDCVFSGKKGGYVESDIHDAHDVYGKTKSLGEVFDKSILNIRCSIIGPEKTSSLYLLEWLLKSEEGSELNGFAHHLWNGVTTLQFARLCERIIDVDTIYDELLEVSHLHHFVPNATINKYDLLCLMANIYKRNLKIMKVDNIGAPVDRTLSTIYKNLHEIYGKSDLSNALLELKEFSEN